MTSTVFGNELELVVKVFVQKLHLISDFVKMAPDVSIRICAFLIIFFH